MSENLFYVEFKYGSWGVILPPPIGFLTCDSKEDAHMTCADLEAAHKMLRNSDLVQVGSEPPTENSLPTPDDNKSNADEVK
jgi:hypothetical protein